MRPSLRLGKVFISVTCTLEAAAGPPLNLRITSKDTSSIGVTLTNISGGTVTAGVLNCIAMHDES